MDGAVFSCEFTPVTFYSLMVRSTLMTLPVGTMNIGETFANKRNIAMTLQRENSQAI